MSLGRLWAPLLALGLSFGSWMAVPGEGAQDALVVSLSKPRLDSFADRGAVGLYFSATREGGEPAGMLGPDHVEVLEDGDPVEVVEFRGEEQGRPVDIVVVFDVTESMQPFLDGMKEAAVEFTNRLDRANRDYRLGLVTFEDYVIREEPSFTRSATEFKGWIADIRAAGGGDIPEDSLDALLAAARFPFRPEAQAVVILITDAPNHFKGDGSEKTNPYGREITRLTVEDVLAEAEKASLVLYAVAPPPFAAPDLHKIVKATAGRLYNIVSEGRRFPELIGEIGRSIASQYFLAYVSPRPVQDGTKRRISLRVKYDRAEGESATTYQVRGVAGARLAGDATAPAGAGRVVYAWWNLAVPLLALAGLVLLSRARLGRAPSAGDITAGAPPAPASPPASGGPTLVRREGPAELPQEYSLSRDEVVIGRGDECDFVIPHPSVSRQHARIKKLTPGHVIFDLQSRNGVWVNGRRTSENLLKDGMTVRIGDVEFVFLAPEH